MVPQSCPTPSPEGHPRRKPNNEQEQPQPLKTRKEQLQQWFHKNGYEPIAPLDFYRAIFPSGELATFEFPDCQLFFAYCSTELAIRHRAFRLQYSGLLAIYEEQIH